MSPKPAQKRPAARKPKLHTLRLTADQAAVLQRMLRGEWDRYCEADARARRCLEWAVNDGGVPQEEPPWASGHRLWKAMNDRWAAVWDPVEEQLAVIAKKED